MSRQVTWEAQAIDQAAGFLSDDPDGVREMLDAVARLAGEPRPAGSFPYGSPDRRRLRLGRYRVGPCQPKRFERCSGDTAVGRVGIEPTRAAGLGTECGLSPSADPD